MTVVIMINPILYKSSKNFQERINLVGEDLIIYEVIIKVYIKANYQILIIIKNGKVGGDEKKV